jgi:hypothetical protein
MVPPPVIRMPFIEEVPKVVEPEIVKEIVEQEVNELQGDKIEEGTGKSISKKKKKKKGRE